MVESLLEILTVRRKQTFCKSIDVHSVINATDEIKVSMIFLAVTFFCRQEVNKLKGRKLFTD